MTPAKNKIKVLFITHYASIYGANLSMIQLIIELRKKGVDCTVMMPCDDVVKGRHLSEELQCHGIPYIATKVKTVKSDSWKKVVAKYFYAHLLFGRVYKSLKGEEFDIVHSNTSVIDAGKYIACRQKIPHVWHIREFGNLDYGLLTPFGRWFQKIIYSGNNNFIAISKKIRDHYKHYLGGQNIRLIYNGVRPSSEIIVRESQTVAFCIVGMLQESKCQLDVVMAAKMLKERGVTNFHVHVIGDGIVSYEEKINRYVIDENLSDCVSMMGRQENVPELLQKMDVGITASSHEAFGRVTVEYMMASLAVIVSDGGANTEIVEDASTGLVYRGGDIVELADKMQFLIENPDMRKRLEKAGYDHAVKNFSSSANTEAVCRLYDELLNKREVTT